MDSTKLLNLPNSKPSALTLVQSRISDIVNSRCPGIVAWWQMLAGITLLSICPMLTCFWLLLYLSYPTPLILINVGIGAVGTWLGLSRLMTGSLQLWFARNWDRRNYERIDRLYSRLQPLVKNSPLVRGYNRAVLTDCLGIVRLRLGFFESAEQLFRQAIQSALLQERQLARHPYVSVLYGHLGGALCLQGQFIDAEDAATEALALLRRKPTAQTRYLEAGPLMILGIAHLGLNELDQAESCLLEARAACNAQPQPLGLSKTSRRDLHIGISIDLALVSAKKGKLEESLQQFKATLNELKADPVGLSTATLEPLYLLANEYMNSENFKEAECALNHAYATGHRFPFHPHSRQLLNYFEKLLLLTNRPDEIEDMRLWLREVVPVAVLPAS